LVDDGVIEKPLDIISDLSEFPLLLELMSICPLPDLEFEKLFKKLRCFILSQVSSLKGQSAELLGIQSALALQCFTNEYIYSTTEEEKKALNALEKTVQNGFRNKEQPSPQIILALASYKALNEYDWCELLVVTDDIQDVLDRHFKEPNEEEKLKQDLPILEEITDGISSKVRAQYEESPYPRWINLGLHLKPMPISKVVDEIKLKLHDNKITEVEEPEILIAGCGTGQHSIGTAARFKGSNVLAIDLSLSSLAYAKRKTKELHIENIEYKQADILDLGGLNKQFDIIESAGVLHHMDNPMVGWKVLTDCLKPGGLMNIALYSELARQPHIKIRDEISEQGIGSSDIEMRLFRDEIIRSKKEHHEIIQKRLDFYSLSTLKDLLFHVQEHRFTIPMIKEHLEKLGLKFCGFESPKIVSNFKQTNTHENDPFDLDKWQEYEEANPKAFAGMYQFWCQKVD
jgi:2-polyprenyl-3-methyl-5-hydroxy-6-metoxy-1,4-benzoquinol methylase